MTSHFMHLWVPTPPPSGRCGTGGMFAQPHHSLRIEPRHGVSSWMGRLYSHSLVSKLSTAPMSSSLSRDAESLGSRGPPQPSLISTDLAANLRPGTFFRHHLGATELPSPTMREAQAATPHKDTFGTTLLLIPECRLSLQEPKKEHFF